MTPSAERQRNFYVREKFMAAYDTNAIVEGKGLPQPMTFRDALLGGVAQHLIGERFLPTEVVYNDILPVIAEHFPSCFRTEVSELYLLVLQRPDGGYDFRLITDPVQTCQAMVAEPRWCIHDIKRNAQRIAATLVPYLRPSSQA